MGQMRSWLARAGDQWSVLVFGAIVVVWNLIVLVRGLIPLVSGSEVDVTVLLSADLPLPIGPGGTPVDAGVSSAQVAVSDLGPFMMIWAVGAVAVVPLATIAVAVLVLILSRNILRGQFFSRTNTWIITSISLVIAGAWVLDIGCTLFTSNWALVQIAGPEGADAFSAHSVIEDTPTAWLPIFASIAMGALASAFSAGERMQRDTEGLV